MKAAIFCGSRDLDRAAKPEVTRIMQHYLRDPDVECIVIQGEARGADIMFRDAAKGSHAIIRGFPAEWDKFGKSAGYKRNSQMLNHLLELKAQGYDVFCVALVEEHMTRGTGMMVDLATRAGVPTSVFSLKHGMIRAR